ncbi:MAG: ATP-dependent helicase [Bacillota bacterium]|nr:ATP-dependent helicase [Bacillota bacterium]
MGIITELTLDYLFDIHGFKPNEGQRDAILSMDEPLFLMAGPGSGKTRVLLWRTVNLIVFKKIVPEKIFLSTFTEKASKQLQEGLQAILGTVTNINNIPYDISRMYIGTIHSLCQRIIGDRRFIVDRSRVRVPSLMDELDQYFFVNSSYFWGRMRELLHVTDDEMFRMELKNYFGNRSSSKHDCTKSLLGIFNRFSEENLSPTEIREKAIHSNDETLIKVANIYQWYKQELSHKNQVDFSLIQQKALDVLMRSEHTTFEFQHVIIDEYQDTNRIQEKLIFRLAKGNKNVCVVGDDDQALYRFRGATVENFVQFPERCNFYLQNSPKEIKLNINYRSRRQIVNTYTSFIEQVEWVREDKAGYYRLHDKNIQAHDQSDNLAVVTSTPGPYEEVAKEISVLVKSLIDEKKVEDPNQIAFLFPALRNNTKVKTMKRTLETLGLKVYAPRSGRFLEVEEPKLMFGLFLHIIGKPEQGEYSGAYLEYHNWLRDAMEEAKGLMKKDERLTRFVDSKKEELRICSDNYVRLLDTVNNKGWTLKDTYQPKEHKAILLRTSGITPQTKRGLGSQTLDKLAEERINEGKPFTLQYMLNRATSVDWSLLDLFYRLTGFSYFTYMFKLAENGTDEGPICNLSMISDYLARYMEQTSSVITGSSLLDGRLVSDFFGRYVYGLFRLEETEFENEETSFPKGRIPFLTIHQSKGLEFPYVVVGSVEKNMRIQKNEEIIRKIVELDAEPLDRMPEFDAMRLFYVALSRAEKALIMARPTGRGTRTHKAFKSLFEEKEFKMIPDIDVKGLPAVTLKIDEIPKLYSYTADYLLYQNCPRNYMTFKKYGFVPSRSQTMFFGNLVHKTIEDIHNRIIGEREGR